MGTRFVDLNSEWVNLSEDLSFVEGDSYTVQPLGGNIDLVEAEEEPANSKGHNVRTNEVWCVRQGASEQLWVRSDSGQALTLVVTGGG